MISDKTLMKLSLAMSVIGIIALFFITQMIEPLETHIDDISDAMAGRNIVVHGTVDSLAENNGNVFIELRNNSKISVVLFEKDAGNVKNLGVGMNVTVIGKLSVYKGSLEIVVGSVE